MIGITVVAVLDMAASVKLKMKMYKNFSNSLVHA